MWPSLCRVSPDSLDTSHVLPSRPIWWTLLSAYTCLCRCVSTPTKGSLHVPDCSSPQCCRFFEALEQRHKAQVCVEDISDILEDHAENHFHPYIAYCSNEVYQQRTLQKLS